jgi:hypothetical protein
MESLLWKWLVSPIPLSADALEASMNQQEEGAGPVIERANVELSQLK